MFQKRFFLHDHISSIIISCLITIGFTLGASAAHFPDTRIIPNGTGLYPYGEYLYTDGARTISRLNRKSGEFETVLKSHREYIYRFAAANDGQRLIVGYELDPRPLLVDLTSKTKVRLPEIKDMYLYDYIFFDHDENKAVIYVRYEKEYEYNGDKGYGYGGFKVVTFVLTPPYRQTVRLFSRAYILFANAHSVVYASLSEKFGTPRDASYFDQIMAVDLESGQSDLLFDFNNAKGYANPHVVKLLKLTRVGEETIAFYARKNFEDDRWLIRYDTVKRKLYRNRYMAELEPQRGSGMSVNKDRFVMFMKGTQETWLALWYDSQIDQAMVINLTPLLDGKLGQLLENGRMFRAGTLADNDTIWLHWGDALLFLNTKGNYSINQLRKYAKIPLGKTIDWAGASYFFSDPDQFYIGIEKGGGRYFMKIDLAKLKLP